jgi:hypothetical protein
VAGCVWAGDISVISLQKGSEGMGAIMNDRIARFLEMIDPENEASTLEMICQRLCDGETIDDICGSLDLAPGRVMSWLTDTEERKGRFKRALEVSALIETQKALRIVDEAVPVLEHGGMDSAAVSDKKLRAEMRLKVAKHNAREYFGDVRKVEHSMGGDFGERLRRARERVIIPAEVSEVSEVSDVAEAEVIVGRVEFKQVGSQVGSPVALAAPTAPEIRIREIL